MKEVKVYIFGEVSSLEIQKCQNLSHKYNLSEKLLWHKMRPSCDVLAAAKNVFPSTSFRGIVSNLV